MIPLIVLGVLLSGCLLAVLFDTLVDHAGREERLARRYQRRLERLERRTMRKVTRRDWS
jgi:hypothetical protein